MYLIETINWPRERAVGVQGLTEQIDITNGGKRIFYRAGIRGNVPAGHVFSTQDRSGSAYQRPSARHSACRAWMRANSSGSRSPSTAPMLASNWLTLLAPGMAQWMPGVAIR